MRRHTDLPGGAYVRSAIAIPKRRRAQCRVPGVLHRELGVLHRVLGVLHRVLGFVARLKSNHIRQQEQYPRLNSDQKR